LYVVTLCPEQNFVAYLSGPRWLLSNICDTRSICHFFSRVVLAWLAAVGPTNLDFIFFCLLLILPVTLSRFSPGIWFSGTCLCDNVNFQNLNKSSVLTVFQNPSFKSHSRERTFQRSQTRDRKTGRNTTRCFSELWVYTCVEGVWSKVTLEASELSKPIL